MTRCKLAATLAASTLTFAVLLPAHALEQAEPPNPDRGGGSWGSIPLGPGPGDPSLGGTRLPPGGDAAAIAAAERAEKAAERKRREAELRRQEEERRRREAEAARTARYDTRRTALPAPLVWRSATTVPPIAAAASAPSTTATRRGPIGIGAQAPSSLAR